MIKAIFFDFDGVLTTDATGTTSIVKYFQNTTNVNVESFDNNKENLVIPQTLGMETPYFDHEERNINTLASHIQESIQKKLHSI